MAIRSQRVVSAFLAGGDARQTDVARAAPAKIILAPEAGAEPSGKPPVRIFVGTEPAQFRAERAFVYSISRVRDPGRTYEIHLMREFAGFKRRLWLTGFTNYRFAIPDLAGRSGRAIYNDADQIYLKDPAELFDTPMGEHGVLSINDRDTSVMLIDCGRMAELWNAETARAQRNRNLEAQMRAVPGLWGPLDGGWNARDEEYVPGESGLVHYTTIHTQPWRPFPRDYVYRANPASDIWERIEGEADAEGFQLFDAKHPSPDFMPAAASAEHTAPGPWRLDEYRRLAADAGAESLHYCGFGDGDALRRSLAPSRLPADAVTNATPAEQAHAAVDVVAADGFEQLPDLDIPWLLDRVFAEARRAVVVTVDPAGAGVRRSPAKPLWWYAQMVAAAARTPGRHWRLAVRHRRFPGRRPVRRWSGGPLLRLPPRSWVLLHYKTGHRSQALGVADALGWPYETREIPRSPLRYLAAAAYSRLRPAAAGLPEGIRPPWPDLVIASGWLASLAARWIAARNHHDTRLILMGRRGGPVGESRDIAIHCRHFGIPPHPRHIETVLPPSKVGGDRLAEAAERWPGLFGDGPRPHVVLLVGGANAQHILDAAQARGMAARVRASVDAAGGTLAVVPSRRTGAAAADALRACAGSGALFEPWQGQREDGNPFLGYLATADILMVTGESESMLAEAVATGKPVYIIPLQASRPNPRRRIANWVVRQARTDRFNARGSRRPQQGLQYLCARLIEWRVFLPPRDLEALHDALVAHGVARRFEDVIETWQPGPWRETEDLADRIRAELQPADADAAASADRADHRAAHA